MFTSLRRRLPRVGRLPRLICAGICLLLAASSALSATQHGKRAAATAAVVVAARDLPAGDTLSRRDLAIARWPPNIRPAGARADPSPLLGRRLAGPLRAREPVTDTRLVGGSLTDALPASTVAAPLMLDDPHAADVVHAGDRVTVLETPRSDGTTLAAAAPASVARIAEHALVLAVLPGEDDSAAEAVLAVDDATAVRITRDRPAQMFTLVVDPP